jgi:OOP family OmpA-OmpF porin
LEKKATAPGSSRRLRGRAGAATGRKASWALEDVRRLVVAPRSVADVLPEAISEAHDRRRRAMTVALAPTLTEAMRAFAQREADLFGELLAPTIGAAVRKAVADAVAALLQRFDEALERSLSLRSLGWRLEARRSGLAFSQVVLIHTLVYRVEQAFLIHAPSGLVLQHVVAANAPSADPDQVASMLAALDAFGREALQPRTGGAHLTELAVGDLKMWVDWDLAIAVALVIRGAAPRELADFVRETREHIHLLHRSELETFSVDVAPFARARPTLEACLREQLHKAPRRAHLVLLVLGAAILVALGWHLVRQRGQRALQARQLAACEQALRTEPGIVVTSVVRRGGENRLTGLRDPLAADPAEVLAGHGCGGADVAFAPFQSLDPSIVVARARDTLRPPDGVQVTLSEGRLRLAGAAPHTWVERARAVAPVLPGIRAVDTAALHSHEETALGVAVSALEAANVQFAVGSDRLLPAQVEAVALVAQHLHRIERLSAALGRATCVTILGQTDRSGSAEGNETLAARRAAAVARALAAHGVDVATLRPRAGSTAGDGASARNARFAVETRAGGDGCGGIR